VGALNKVCVTGLTNNQLKIIAMVSMLLDHIGLELLPQFPVLRILGRLAFPVFAYMIAEGCAHTKNRKRYFWQIAGLGLACQAVFTIVDGSWYMGILITFSLAVLTIFSIDWYRKQRDGLSFVVMTVVILSVLFLTLIAPELFEKQGFLVDYGLAGVLLPVAVYYGRGKKQKLLLAAAVLVVFGLISGGIRWYSLLALPLLLLYNQKRGTANLKYLFYIFYPSHLAAIYLVGMIV